jgi:TonB-linked SusC/RagA family outer membrane protein
MALLCMLLQAGIAQAQVTGRVTDARDGTPLSGVTVTIKNTNTGTTTDANGTFSLNAPSNSRLVFSFVGYQNLELSAGNASNVTLTRGENELSEVVVVGYGTRVRRDLTGSVAKVSGSEINNLPLPSFETALQGRASGVFINSGSGKLGQGLDIRIRGISSISASTQPLFVIDGVPVISQPIGNLSSEPDNPLAAINPNDIESIEVLKDASSAAIYGSRAANGVVIVTTKTGKAGKTRVNFGVFAGVSSPTRKREFLNAAEYRELFTDAIKNSTRNGVSYARDDAAAAWRRFTGNSDWANNQNVDVNWSDQAFQDGSVQQYVLSLSGGDNKTKFLISGTYNDQKGIVLGDALKKFTGKLNLDHNLTERIRIGLNVAALKMVHDRVPDDNEFNNPLQLNALPPIQKVYNDDGTLNRQTIYYNNLIDRVANVNQANTTRSIGNLYGQLNINKNLYFRSEFGYDWQNLEEDQFYARNTETGATYGGLSSSYYTNVSTWNVRNYLNYTQTFNDIHELSAVTGIEYQEYNSRANGVQGSSLPNDQFKKIASAAKIIYGNSNTSNSSFASYFLRGNYKFNDRYLLQGSVRVDGSSRFASDNRFGVFPSVSAGWILSEENFLKESDAISYLKLRAGYGRTGNAEIGNFAYRTLWAASFYADQAGIIPSQIGRDDLKWETSDQIDIGLDFGIINNRVTAEVDYYVKKTKDLLLDFQLPTQNGFSIITKNIGRMENRGWEFTVNSRNLTGAFKWNTSVNFSTYKNEVTDMGGSTLNGGSRQLGRVEAGKPFGYFYGPKYLGVDPANGDALYADAAGKPTNDENLAADFDIGNPHPDFYGGINNNFSYKNFDLDIQSQFVSGNDLYNIAGFFQSVNGDFYDNQTKDQMSYWRKPGDITNVPQPRFLNGNGAIKSSRWVQDGSYFRIKNVVLGYNFSRDALRRLRIENARVYLAANNLFTFTDYNGYDPEVNATYISNINLGHDFYTPPQARTITVGINIGF